MFQSIVERGLTIPPLVSQLALQTATRFGLNDENTMLQIANGNLVQLGRLQVTWASICQLFSLPTTTVRRTDPRSAVM
jgi:hypothetical protein